MNCTKCNIQMDEGMFDRTLWIKKGRGKLNRLMVGKIIGADWIFTIAYRCPSCKKIELYTEDVRVNAN